MKSKHGLYYATPITWWIILALLLACNGSPPHHRVMVLQPIAGFSKAEARLLAQQIAPFHDKVLVNEPLPFPASAWVPARSRHRADTLLRHLRVLHGPDTLVVGLTHADISTTKGKVADWGVMGLGYRPGNACVVSTFRLKASKRREQLFKVVLHEIGHTYGLPHCPNTTCLMRDAEGKNPLDEEKEFCSSCQNQLAKLGFGNQPPS